MGKCGADASVRHSCHIRLGLPQRVNHVRGGYSGVI
jgi:hypothetical protein